MLTLLRSIAGNVRNALASGIVSNINDSGAAQTITVQTHGGTTRAQVEVHQQFGFSSVAPANGAYSLVYAVGNDVGNLIALPPANPYARFGGMKAGESVMYGSDGSRVRIKNGGIVEIWGGTQVNIYTKDMTVNASDVVTVNAANGVIINGNVQVNGNLTTSGTLSDSHGSLDRLRGHYDAHTHFSSTAGSPTSITSAIDSE
ncbi:MAG: hypothetical protein B7Z80_25790 [Rhodospirillales bacterium 20-64-7]|nr:MAG: hypothetical protein B7Z80_25790 [Rhodospirillales bacterium 20-64-7]